jgi:hypothetical protein
MTDGHSDNGAHREANRPYVRLLIMTLLSFTAMCILMYAMIDNIDNIRVNLNQFYMAALMVAAVVVIELVVMGGVYHNGTINTIAMGAALASLILFWVLIRLQTGVSDEQLLKSMIPHHAGAVLICEQASITDSEVQRLCERIRTNQRAELDEMKAILRRLEEKKLP